MSIVWMVLCVVCMTQVVGSTPTSKRRRRGADEWVAAVLDNICPWALCKFVCNGGTSCGRYPPNFEEQQEPGTRPMSQSRTCYAYIQPGWGAEKDACDGGPKEDLCACITDGPRRRLQIGYGEDGEGRGKPGDDDIDRFCRSNPVSSTYECPTSTQPDSITPTAMSTTTTEPQTRTPTNVAYSTTNTATAGRTLTRTPPARTRSTMTISQAMRSSVTYQGGTEVLRTTSLGPMPFTESAPFYTSIAALGLILLILLVALFTRSQRSRKASSQVNRWAHKRVDAAINRLSLHRNSPERMNITSSDVVSTGARLRTPPVVSADGARPDNSNSGYECPDPVAATRNLNVVEPTTSNSHQPSSEYLELYDNTSDQSQTDMHDYTTVSNVPVDLGLTLKSHSTKTKSMAQKINHGPLSVHSAPSNDDPSIAGYDDVVVQNNPKQVAPSDDDPSFSGHDDDVVEKNFEQLAVDTEQDRSYVNKTIFAKRHIIQQNIKPVPQQNDGNFGEKRPGREKGQKSLGRVKPVSDPPVSTKDVYDYAEISSNPHPGPESAQANKGQECHGPVKPYRDPLVPTEYVYDYAEVSGPHPCPKSTPYGGQESQGPVKPYRYSLIPTEYVYDYVGVPSNRNPRTSSPACLESIKQGQGPSDDGGYQALDPVGLERANKYTALSLESRPTP